MRYNLYVPSERAVHDIWPGSAIVGEERDGMVMTHYEGGQAENVKTFEDRILHAAGRRKERYPTSAQRGWDLEDIQLVGTVLYDDVMRIWVIDQIMDEAALRGWIGEDEPIVIGGSDGLIVDAGSRLFAQLPPHEQTRIQAMRLPMVALCAEAIASARRRTGGT